MRNKQSYYRATHVKIWEDRKFRKLTPYAKLIFWYCYSNKHTHVSGLYCLPMSYIMADLGMGEEQINRAVMELEEQAMIHYDRDEEWVFVPNMLKHQGRNASTERAARKAVEHCESEHAVAWFNTKYPELAAPVAGGPPENEKQDAESMGTPCTPPCDTQCTTPCVTPETETETETETCTDQLTTDPVSGAKCGGATETTQPATDVAALEKAGVVLTTKRGRKLEGDQLKAFLMFWTAFDDKRSKREAADAWYDLKLVINAENVNPILHGAKRYAAVRGELIRRGQTPKMAQGWLSARRWEDEATVARPKPRAVY